MRALGGDDALEAPVARQAQQDARVVRVVLDDEQHGVALLDVVAVVRDVLLARDRQDVQLAWRSRRRPTVAAAGARRVRARVVQRQVEGEGAALAVDAGELDLAAQQHGQLAADGQAQAGAAVLARGAGVGLLEGLEDEPLLLRRDADAGVLDGEGDHLLAPCSAPGDRGSSPRVARPTRTSTWPCAVNLTALDSRFLRICCRRFGVAVHGARQVVGEVDVERQVLGLGHVPEVAVDGVAQAGEGDLLDLDRDRAGLDLREVEDVVDQVAAGRSRTS